MSQVTLPGPGVVSSSAPAGGGGTSERNVVFGAEAVTLDAVPLTITMEGTGDVELVDALAALTGDIAIGSESDSITLGGTGAGNIVLRAGDGDAGSYISITGGAGAVTTGGIVTLSSGNGATDAGIVGISGGEGAAGIGGAVELAGGSGVTPGRVKLLGVDASDPVDTNAVWNDTGDLKISAGA